MIKVLQMMVIGTSVLLLALSASGEETPKEQTQGAPAPGFQTVVVPREQAIAPPKVQAAGAAREQMKGLDEQVQEIKTDVLSVAAQLKQLEEKLLYPTDTQIAIFVSVAKGEKFRLDAVDLELDGKPVAHHLYTFKELEALQKGGVQRIYVGNVRTGDHPLQVTVSGKTEGGADFRKSESFTVTKNIGPRLVGLVLSGPGIGSKTATLKDW